jgi:hypothetical protein
MNCPKCASRNIKVTHSYSTEGGTVQRRLCQDCLSVLTTQVVLLNIDPPRGEGASSLAKRLKDQRSSDSQM